MGISAIPLPEYREFHKIPHLIRAEVFRRRDRSRNAKQVEAWKRSEWQGKYTPMADVLGDVLKAKTECLSSEFEEYRRKRLAES